MYDNTFDNISIGEKARECLPLSEIRKDGNHFVCPVCGGGKLWVSPDDSNKVSCRSNYCTGIYKAIGDAYKGGGHVVVNRKKESAPKPEGVRLPAKDRDKAIRSIIQQLPLESVDRADLVEKRGLNDEQVRKYGFFTTKNGSDRNNSTCLDYPVNSDLAGMAVDGLHFTARGDCYNIPIQNVYGQYVSFKVKPRDPGNGGKYLTAVSKARPGGRKVKAESHTAEFGCLPLQHTILDSSPGKPLFFSEGELKGIIIAERHGGNTVSASGCQFLLNNGGELANTLKECQPSECIAFPDAGTLKNPGILNEWRKLDKFLTERGYTLLVSDWGQGRADKKTFPDGDEIESGAYRIIPFSEWDDQPQEAAKTTVSAKASEPVDKLTIKNKNGDVIQLTDAGKELAEWNDSQLDIINPFKPVIRICTKATDKKDIPQFVVPEFVKIDELLLLLAKAKVRVKYSLHSLSLKQIKTLLKQYGLKGYSVFTKTDLLTGKMPPKQRRDENGKVMKNDMGEYLVEWDENDKPVDRYSADEFAVLTELYQALKAIDLCNHKELFDTTKVIQIDLLVEHPAKSFISTKINEKFNNMAFKKPTFTCHFRLDSLADKPFLRKDQWTKNSIDAFDKDPVNLEQFLLWQRLNIFTADIHDNTQYISNSDVFSNIDLLDGHIHLLAGGLGGGKTTDLIKKIVDLIAFALSKSDRPLKILFAGYRLNLNANTINKIKVALINKAHEIGTDILLGKQLLDVSSYVHDSEAFKKKFGYFTQWKADKRLILFCCVDSLPQCVQRMDTKCQEDMLIIMDECDAVAKHMVKGSTCKGKRTRILEGFDKLLNNCLGVYGLSGTLNDATKQLFEGCGKEIITYQNDYLPEPTTIQLSIGYGDVDFLTEIIKLKQSELSQILDEIIERVNNGERLIICSDSQQQNEKLERLIRDKCGDVIIVRIDADTKIDPARQADVAAIMADPGRVIPEKNVQVLIYNSSAESGVDMSFAPDHQKYFDKLFGFSFNVIGTNAMIQLLKRYRHKLDLFMWCSAGKNSQTDMPAIPAHRVNEVRMERKGKENRDDRTNLRYNNARRIEGYVPIGHTENKFTRLANDLEFMEKFERRHPRICLQWMLKKHGYNVEMMYTTEETGTDTSEQKKQMIAERVQLTMDASDEYIGKPIEDDQNITTLDQKYAIAKATILRQLNYSKDDYQRDDVPLFNPEIVELIGVTNKGYINTIRNWVYVDLPGAELKLLQRFDYKSEAFLNDVKLMQRPMKWITEMGLPAILSEIKNSITTDDDDMLQISANDKRINKIQKWAKYKTNNDKWRLLTGSFYQEKMFVFQLTKLLSRYFGVKVFVKEKSLFIKPDRHRAGILERVAMGIDHKIFRCKVQRYFFTKKREWAEVVNDARFAYEYKQIADRYEQNYGTGELDWIINETNYEDHVATWEDPDYSESATRSDKVEVETEAVVNVDADTNANTPINTIECTAVPVVPLPVPAMMALSNTNVAVLDRITITESLEAGCYMAITPTLSDYQLNITNAVVKYQGKTFTPHTRHDDGAETSIIFECGREYIAVQYYNAPPTQLWQAKVIVNITSALNTNWWQF